MSFAYWPTTALVALLFAVPGAALTLGYPHFVSDMALLGYPSYFPLLLGLSKLAAVTVIVAPGFPRLKEWAYAGMVVDVFGAIASRVIVEGVGISMVIPTLVGALTLTSWITRPASRRLGAILTRAARV